MKFISFFLFHQDFNVWFVISHTYSYVYIQPAFTHLALGWQIVKQLAELNPLWLSNSRNCRLKKVESFLRNQRKIAVKLTIHQNSAVSKVLLGKFYHHWSQISILNSENYCIPRRHKLLGQTTKQQLSNFERPKAWKYMQLWGLRPDSSCL